MSKRKRVELTAREVEIISKALPVYIEEQLRPEADPLRLANVERFEAAFPHRDGRYTVSQINEMYEACDAYLYWEVSDPQDRDSGFVYWDPEEDEPGTKMARDDRSEEYVEACREVDELARKLERLSC